MHNATKERDARREETRRRSEERRELWARTKGQGISRPFTYVRYWFSKLFSNLRFSLTLRIAIHYCCQLLCTTLLMMLAVTVAIGVAQIPTLNDAFDRLTKQRPADGAMYTAEQLVGLPIVSAYTLEEPYPENINGVFQRLRLIYTSMRDSRGRELQWYRNTVRGGTIAAFSLQYIGYLYTIVLCTLLCCDLLRVLQFLSKRYRLNKTVLKPIQDMTTAAAALSANNLSNRINIAGTKNELKDLAGVINGMLDRIEHSYNSQKQFVSDASHELRTPIAVIQGYASMLERWGKTDKDVLDEGIEAISQETASMKELVERLLFLARHDKKTLMLEMEDFDPTEVVSAVHRDAKMLSSQHTFELSQMASCTIRADKSMIKQLMRILVDNAIKYTPPGGSITLGVRQKDGNCVLSVTDTGPGISAAELPRIFDRFYRSDKARKAQTGGHGLGLSIARIIVVAHNGKINVRSKEGVGTTFSIVLPLSDGKETPAPAQA